LNVDIPGSFYTDQFNNPANSLSHYSGTAPEIWAQTGHQLDAIVCGVGSGGTLAGLSRFFRDVKIPMDFVLADPKGSILTEYVETGKINQVSGSWAVEGIGEDFIPSIADFTSVKKAYTIDDEESFRTARQLLSAEGIMGGSSTGTLLAAALRYCREQTTPKRVVSFVCDTGTRYLSKVYNDNWMIDQGLLKREAFGDLRDIIGRRYSDGGVISVAPTDTLMTAFNRMRNAEISQMPVIQDGRIVGIIDESDILIKVTTGNQHFQQHVAQTMTSNIETLTPGTHIEVLRNTLNRSLIAIIADQEKFYGLITRFDLLNHLRRTLS
jgi:cystathionine beta-synthase